MSTRLPKPKRKRKGGLEYCYACPRCGEGSVNKFPLEVNVRTGLFNCLRCGYSGKLEELDGRRKNWAVVAQEQRREGGDVGPVPDYVYRRIQERGFEPQWIIERYQVGWDGSRLCWPVDEGYWRRAIYTEQSPKVVMDPGSHVLLGGHLLRPSASVVLTEGDYKAAAIPLPFIGCAIGGTGPLNEEQITALLISRPYRVLVWLDGGVLKRKIDRIINQLAERLVDAVSVEPCGRNKGPDDIPMVERMSRLVRACREG